MRWTDDGIFLSGRPFGETSVIADVFTREHGRTLGLIKGGRSRQLRPLLQTGNVLRVEWRARLEEQLGVYTAELQSAVAERVIDDALCLKGLMSLAALLQVLPERDPHPELYEKALSLALSVEAETIGQDMVFFELNILHELGFGLELTECAATGVKEDLIYVSPKSAQAVSAAAGEPYKGRLLALPQFLTRDCNGTEPTQDDLMNAFSLTGYFLDLHVFGQNAKSLPPARKDFVSSVCGRKSRENARIS
jgi:DNA repair protein RecO (recombination protein O)